MKQKPVIRQKTFHCGTMNQKTKYIEVDIFEHVDTMAARKARKRRELLTPPKQQNLNDKNARRYFVLLVKSNFDNGDIHITLTYDENFRPETIEEAEHQVQLFIDRLRTLYKKHGAGKVHYIFVTEQGAKKGRIHHHVLLKNVGISRDEIEERWKSKGLGNANSKRLRADENGIERLANYLQKGAAGKKRWKNSKGLVRPWLSVSDGKHSRRKIDKLAQLPPDCEAVKEFWEKQFPGYVLYECQHYFNQVTAQWSIYLKMRLRR